ncbi:hypothetical protein ERJ75_000629300 [Trypanosoma vivax]|nr:hypothetical protein ERJ75_000629300 [Trypanosoma vivax]
MTNTLCQGLARRKREGPARREAVVRELWLTAFEHGRVALRKGEEEGVQLRGKRLQGRCEGRGTARTRQAETKAKVRKGEGWRRARRRDGSSALVRTSGRRKEWGRMERRSEERGRMQAEAQGTSARGKAQQTLARGPSPGLEAVRRTLSRETGQWERERKEKDRRNSEGSPSSNRERQEENDDDGPASQTEQKDVEQNAREANGRNMTLTGPRCGKRRNAVNGTREGIMRQTNKRKQGNSGDSRDAFERGGRREAGWREKMSDGSANDGRMRSRGRS